MRKIFSTKKWLYLVLPLLAIGFVAWVPVDENKTLWEQLVSAFPSADADEKQQEKSKQSLNELWEELQKISQHNGEDTVMLSGVVKLYDNVDDEGIREQQRFMVRQAGMNQWFHLDSFDRILYDETMFLIDHVESEIIIQRTTVTDSLMKAFSLMDPKKFKELLVKDGTVAELDKTGPDHKITITPGLMDAVNRYEVSYDPQSYQIKRFCIFYTSLPYQGYVESNNVSTEESSMNDVQADDDAIDANITEYVLEFEIQQKEKRCDMDFTENDFYSINDQAEVRFKAKFKNYRKIRMQE